LIQKSIDSSAAKSELEAVLFEGIHSSAVEALQQAGYTRIVTHAGSLSGDQLLAAIADAHFVGVRSRTHLSAEVLRHAQRLVAIGCFCIGTNQVDLKLAMRLGIPVFNAPFSNTRSVASRTALDQTLTRARVEALEHAVPAAFFARRDSRR
jgi:D-3-phosphoglycerate dehydrogenase